MIDYPTQHKVEIFNLFCLMRLTAVVCTGVNYTLLRFLPASYFGLLVQRVDKQEGRNSRALAMLMSVGFTGGAKAFGSNSVCLSLLCQSQK